MLDTLKKHALRVLNVCLIAAVALLVIDVLLGVASRYLWGAQIKWTEELAGAGMKLKMAFFIHFVTLAFTLIVFEIGGVKLVMQALHHWNVLPALQVSDVVQYLPLPVSGLFILLFEVCNLREDLKHD